MKEKKKVIIKCPDCEKEIIGFSQHHAEQNLMIHQKTSEECKRIRKLLNKKNNNNKK